MREAIGGPMRSFELNPKQVRLLELLEAGRSTGEIAREFVMSQRTIGMHIVRLMQIVDVSSQSELVASWRRTHEPDHPERIHLAEIGPSTKGTRRCMSPECEYGGRW